MIQGTCSKMCIKRGYFFLFLMIINKLAYAVPNSGGFYTGISLSHSNALLDTNRIYTFTDTQRIRKWNLGLTGWSGELVLGKDYHFSNYFYFAAETFIDFSSLRGVFHRIDQLNHFSLFRAEGITVKNPYTLGAVMKPGFELVSNLVFYGAVGYVSSRFEIRNPQVEIPFSPLIGSQAKQLNFNKNQEGLLVGFGLSQVITPHITIREEYNNSIYRSIQAQALTKTGNLWLNREVSFNPIKEQFIFSLIYHFEPVYNIESFVMPLGYRFFLGGRLNRSSILVKTYGTTKAFLMPQNEQIALIQEYFDYKETGFEGELFAGVGKLFQNKFYLAGQLFQSFAHIGHSGTFFSQDFNFQANWKMGNGYGIEIMPGYQISKPVRLYGIAGLALTNFALEEQLMVVPFSIAAQAVNFKKAKRLAGLRLGIGQEILLNLNWNIRTEFNITTYQGVSGGRIGPIDHNIGERQVAQLTMRPVVNQFKMSLVYNFN